MKTILNNNKEFLTKLIAIASPIIIQSFITSSLNFLNVFMVGQLGENEIAAVGIGNQVYFLFQMFIFSLASGTSIFVSQYWGGKKLKDIHSAIGIGLSFTLSVATVFTFFVMFFTKDIISIYSNNSKVIEFSSPYTKIIAISFIISAFSYLYSSVLKSTENVKFPLFVGLIAIFCNFILNYLLIFGNFGFPRLGINGTAVATVTARIIEFVILLAGSYIKKYPTIAPLRQLFNFTKYDIKQYLGKTLPVLGQSMGWSLGFSMYSVIYSNIGIESFAAFNLADSIEKVCLTLFTGMGIACAIMVGNKIGAHENDNARKYSINFIFITIIFSIIVSSILILMRGHIIHFYNLDEKTKEYLYKLLLVIGIILMARAMNIIFMMGILKAGGDTFFAMIVDVGGIWLIGLPIAAFSAFSLRLPVYYVVAFAATEEFVKMSLCIYRFSKNRCLKNLTTQVEDRVLELDKNELSK